MSDETASEKTEAQQRSLANLIPYQPGQSGNPAGRPRGARSKLTEAFLSHLQADFEAHGLETIEKVRTDKPADYLRTVAALMPKQVEGSDDPDAPPIKHNVTLRFE